MPTMKRIYFASVLVLALLTTAVGQESAGSSVQRSSLTITASAAGDRVRITAPSSVVQMRVEVYAPSGEKLFDQEIRGGNVFDWRLQDGQAQRLAPGAYVCVVTAKSISGKLTQKIGTVTVEEKSVSVQQAVSLSAPQAQTSGPVEENSSWTVPGKDESQTPTVIANDGTDGQMIRGRGALSFRIGNFFSGMDQEQMRLTEAGNLGIGTSVPQAKLDVAGTIRAERFLIAKPKLAGGDKSGTLAADSGDSVQPLTSGTGTPNQIAKWILADTLGDSGITEAGSGNIGINQAAPDGKLSIVTAANTYALRTSGGNLETYLQHGASSGTWFTNSTGGFTINNQAGPLAFSANNIEYMRIVNTGSVGIGTAAPGGRLHIGTAANTYALRTSGGNLETYLQHGASAGIWYVNSSGGFTINNQAGPLAFSANNVEAFRITNAGSIGFGTAAPEGRLHIGTAPNTYALRTSGGNLETYLQHGATSGTWYTNSSGGFTLNNQAGPLAFSANNAEVMRISNTGNVGIGTTTPAKKLDVAGDINTSNDYNIGGSRVLSVAGTNNVFAGVNAGTNNTGSENAFFGRGAGFKNTTGANNSFFGYQAGNQGMEGINNSFFGAAAGFNTIHDSANTGFTDYNSFFGAAAGYSNTTGGHNAFFGAAAGFTSTTGGSNAFFGSLAGLISTGEFDTFVGANAGNNNTSGNYNTLIGFFAEVASGNLNHATAIGAESSVSTSNSISLGRSDGSDTVNVWGVLRTGLDGSGSVDVCRNTDLRLSNCSSSLRYKTGIQPFTRGLDVVRRLRPITFNWKDGGMSDVGFGAEDVEQVEPLLTTRNDRGEIEGVKYKQLTTVLVNAIKEQQAQITRQQEQLNGLKKMVCRSHRHASVCR